MSDSQLIQAPPSTGQPDSTSPKNLELKMWIIRVGYFLAWLVAPFLLYLIHLENVANSPALKILLRPEQIARLRAAEGAILYATWTAIILLTWIAAGDGSGAHKLNFANYRSIWASFVLVILFLGLASYIFYADVVERVRALRGGVSLISDTLGSLPSTASPDEESGLASQNQAETLQQWIGFGLSETRTLNDWIQDTRSAANLRRSHNLPLLQRNLYGSARHIGQLADMVSTLAQEIATQEKMQAGLLAAQNVSTGVSLEPLLPVTGRLLAAAREIEGRTDDLLLLMETIPTTPTDQDERLLDQLSARSIILTNYYFQARALNDAAIHTLVAANVNMLAPFVLVNILYQVFLLFPWVLLFLFLMRKRESQVKEKAQVLRRMGIAREFVQRTQAEPVERISEEMLLQEVGESAFRNSEYVVSLTIFTVVTATVWYFIFYPQASSGLAEMISRGGGVQALESYLLSNSTPMTIGFMGAYFFVIQMLLRRYFAADLNPRAYTYAVVRLLTVFILALVFKLGAGTFGIKPEFAAIAVFVVGIFPMAALIGIVRWVEEKVPLLRTEGAIEQAPLTRLDGLNAWHEARLLEEKLENVQNLATASLDDLIVHTNFTPVQLIDWVDQALLYIHTGERWYTPLHAVGIRTATDLLDSTRAERGVSFSEGPARRLVAAVNAALDQPAEAGSDLRAAARLEEQAASLKESARLAQATAEQLSPEQPSSVDSLPALKTRLEEIDAAVQKIRDESLQAVKQAAEIQGAAGGAPALTDLEKAAGELTAQVGAARQTAGQIDPSRAGMPDQVAGLKSELDQAATTAGILAAHSAAALETARQSTPGGNGQVELTARLGELDSQARALQVDIQAACELAEPLAADKVETLSGKQALQVHLEALYAAAVQIGQETREAREAVKKLPPSRLESRSLKKMDAAVATLEPLLERSSRALSAVKSLQAGTAETLQPVKSSIQAAAAAASEAQAALIAAASGVQAATEPARITVEILEVMVKTIQRGPNIERVRDFWKYQGQISSRSTPRQPQPVQL